MGRSGTTRMFPVNSLLSESRRSFSWMILSLDVSPCSNNGKDIDKILRNVVKDQ